MKTFFSFSGVPQNSGGKGDSLVFTITSSTSSIPAPGRDRLDGHLLCPRVDGSTQSANGCVSYPSTNQARLCLTSVMSLCPAVQNKILG